VVAQKTAPFEASKTNPVSNGRRPGDDCPGDDLFFLARAMIG
jgi:hypothetical protein